MSRANETMIEVSSFVFQNFTVLMPFLGALCEFFESVILQLFVFSAPGISAERSSAIPVLLLDFPGLLVAYLSKFDAWQVSKFNLLPRDQCIEHMTCCLKFTSSFRFPRTFK